MSSEISHIKSINTEYDNHFFRSRLEARWAHFFNALDIQYEYEIETYDLGSSGYYLPDFWLPEHKCWVEIKGIQPNDVEKKKMKALTEVSFSYGFIFSGQIEVPSVRDYCNPEANSVWDAIIFDENHQTHTQARLFDDFSKIRKHKNKTNEAACIYASGKELTERAHWFTCVSCGKPAIYIDGYECDCGKDSIDYGNVIKLVDAYKKARSARFEFEDRFRRKSLR